MTILLGKSACSCNFNIAVMPGLDPNIQGCRIENESVGPGIAGSSPAITKFLHVGFGFSHRIAELCREESQRESQRRIAAYLPILRRSRAKILRKFRGDTRCSRKVPVFSAEARFRRGGEFCAMAMRGNGESVVRISFVVM
jgi:hypothetical protein